MNKYVKYWILFIYLHQVCAVGPPPHHPDLRGSYCASRPGIRCCRGRQDECSAPILDTLCYCDDFCNRTRNDDCCPDFWTLCKGYIPPPEPQILALQCEHQGVKYDEGSNVKLNCRDCKCQSVDNGAEAKLLCDDSVCLVEEDLLNRINRNYRNLGYTATNYTTFWGRRYEEGLHLRLGTLKSKKKELYPVNQLFDESTIPRVFDSRLNWSDIISRPRDQGWCASSWIFSTVSVASDRFAIMTYGNDKTFLSPQQLLDCVRDHAACEGGYLTRAWTFIRKYGLVPDNCYPWEYGRQSPCRIKTYKKRLEATCPVNSQSERALLHRVGPVYRIDTEKGIMYEIMKSGPVQATMKVTREFFVYQKGVFRCANLSNNDRTGYHAVRIIGWGEEFHNNQLVKYWIVSNSWGEWWGEDGYFRILRGVNECGIEDFVIAVWANIEDLKTSSKTIRQASHLSFK